MLNANPSDTKENLNNSTILIGAWYGIYEYTIYFIKMKTLSDISCEEFAELIIFIDKKVLGKTKYPHPDGLLHYRNEVIQSIRHIKDGITEKLRQSRLSPVLTEEFLPFFVIKWLQERGFLNAL